MFKKIINFYKDFIHWRRVLNKPQFSIEQVDLEVLHFKKTHAYTTDHPFDSEYKVKALWREMAEDVWKSGAVSAWIDKDRQDLDTITLHLRVLKKKRY